MYTTLGHNFVLLHFLLDIILFPDLLASINSLWCFQYCTSSYEIIINALETHIWSNIFKTVFKMHFLVAINNINIYWCMRDHLHHDKAYQRSTMWFPSFSVFFVISINSHTSFIECNAMCPKNDCSWHKTSRVCLNLHWD